MNEVNISEKYGVVAEEYTVDEMKALQGVPFEKVGFNPLSWRLFMIFCLWC